MFRRMLQSNGATTVLDFTPVPDKPPTVTINRHNQVLPHHARDFTPLN